MPALLASHAKFLTKKSQTAGRLDWKPILSRACLQRYRRPRADVLDDFRRGEAAEAGGGALSGFAT